MRPPYPFANDHKAIVKKLAADKENAVVFSNDLLSAELSEYFLNFHTGRLTFMPIGSSGHLQNGNIYYMVNGEINITAKNKIDSIMKMNTDTSVYMAYRSNNVFLYKVDSSFLQKIK